MNYHINTINKVKKLKRYGFRIAAIAKNVMLPAWDVRCILAGHLERQPEPVDREFRIRDPDPTPEEIEERCKEIQAQWSPEERAARMTSTYSPIEVATSPLRRR